MTEGTYIEYKPQKFQKERLAMIGQINKWIEEYDRQGMSLTVRQLFYKFVTLNLVENSDSGYGKVQSVINDGRMAGQISWTAIEDRNRSLLGWTTYPTPQTAMRDLAKDYKRDCWETQDWRVEVWVEKAALLGVVGAICEKLRVDYYAQRGYNSTSEHWRAGQRFARYTQKGQRVIVFHLGDHDPSGMDMTRSNAEKLELFTGTPIIVQRLALNRDQIDKYDPPPQYAKRSDVRSARYVEEHGKLSWELDALDPVVIQDIITTNVLRVRDETRFNECILREEQEKRYIEELAK